MSLASVVADAGGRYAISGLEPGRHHVYAVEPRSRGVEIDIRPGQNDLDLVAEEKDEPLQSVSGRIVDTAGQPVVGAGLRLAAGDVGTVYNTSSLSDGAFIFTYVQRGRYELRAGARGFVPFVAPGSVDVSETPIEGLTLTLERAGAVISGRLTGVGPEEVAQLRVGATALDAEEMAMSMTDWPGKFAGEVDGSGAYRIVDLAPGPWFVTAISASGHSASAQVTLEPGVAEAHLDLDLGGGFTLSGEVSAQGQPAAGARLVLAGADPSPSVRAAEAAADGTFSIAALKAGTYRLIILDPLRFGALLLLVEIAADLGVSLDLTPGKLGGRVVTAGGEPVAGATVEAEAIDPRRPVPLQPPRAVTDASGGFEVASLPANAYRVTAAKEGFQPAGVEVAMTPGETATVELELVPTGTPKP